jgi:hypothetical protein
MAITHFIAGAHKYLINVIPNTRARPFERFLRWQRTNVLELIARDEDLLKAIAKMEIMEFKRTTEKSYASQYAYIKVAENMKLLRNRQQF